MTNELEYHRDMILEHLGIISDYLKNNHPQQYDIAYSHWIPQIITALKDDQRWLPRGIYNLQNTIDNINDTNFGSGVSKYIK